MNKQNLIKERNFQQKNQAENNAALLNKISFYNIFQKSFSLDLK